MTAFSSSGVWPTISSTSQPRSRKICAALGSILSEMSTRGLVMIYSLSPLRERAGERRSPSRPCGWKHERVSPSPNPLPSSGEGFRLRTEAVPSPIEPRPERLDIGGVDGRAAPDPQARRGVAVTGDVVGRALGFEQTGEPLDEVCIGVCDRQADAGLRAGRRVRG